MSIKGTTLIIYKLHSNFWSKVDKTSLSVQVYSCKLKMYFQLRCQNAFSYVYISLFY
jgi:hypothetical protein